MSSAPSPSLPRLSTSYLRAVAPWKRAAGAQTAVPQRQSLVCGWVPDREQLAAYRALLGSSAEVPLAFPQVPVMAMTMDLVTQWSFPVRAVGLIHLGGVVEVLGGLTADSPWDVRAWVGPGRNVRWGLEFDVLGEVSVDGRPRWRSRAIYLSRSRAAGGAQESAVPDLPEAGPWDDQVAVPVPEDVGRAFGRLSGDVNPIHLHRTTARPFGMPGAIAHGWWIAGRVAALVDADECRPDRTLQIGFRKPVRLPSTPILCTRRANGQVDVALMGEPSDREPAGELSAPVLVVGRITG